jgi:hypothetical protein
LRAALMRRAPFFSSRSPAFSIDNSVRILDESSQESLAEYNTRPPPSLKKIR